jgi:opacity protein-like surface antigen
MKTIKYFLVAAAIGACNVLVHAQTGLVRMNISYAPSFPTGSFHKFINDPSYSGFDMAFMYGINDKVSVGFNTGFRDYYQKYPRQVYKLADGGDISAVVSNSVQTVPLMLKANYNLRTGKRLQPFAGVAAGGNLVLYRQFLGEFGSSKNKFTFEAQPELGIYMAFNGHSEAGITLSGVYNFIPFNYAGVSNLNSAGIKLGISFPMRD